MDVASGCAKMDTSTAAQATRVRKSVQLEAEEGRKQAESGRESDVPKPSSGCRTCRTSHEVEPAVVVLLLGLPGRLRALP
jgi:hypothetical protein